MPHHISRVGPTPIFSLIPNERSVLTYKKVLPPKIAFPLQWQFTKNDEEFCFIPPNGMDAPARLRNVSFDSVSRVDYSLGLGTVCPRTIRPFILKQIMYTKFYLQIIS